MPWTSSSKPRRSAIPAALCSPVMPSFMWTSPRAMSQAPIRIISASSWTREVSPARIGTSS